MVVGAVDLAACERMRASGCAASWTTSRARYSRRLLGRISGRRAVCICSTWDQVLAALTAKADAVGAVDWSLSEDSTIARAHQLATNIARHTGGFVELQESEHIRAA